MDTKMRKLLELTASTAQQMQQALDSFAKGLREILNEVEAPKPIEVPPPVPAPAPLLLIDAIATGATPHIALSQRERSILLLLMDGQSNKGIARALNIAEATVKVHVKAVLRKLRLTNRTQAAVWAQNNPHITELDGAVILPQPIHSASVGL